MSMHLIIPGDSLPLDTSNASIMIGPGIYKIPQTQEVIPSSAGALNIKTNKSKNKQLAYIESNSKRYIPQTNDFVIGIIVGVYGEYYRVSLQDFSTPVQLSMMAFPNATKKNRPNLKIGQAIYARVTSALSDVETELECIDPTTGKEGGFGLLDESGYIFEINLHFARELLFNSNSMVLEKLANKCKFEIAVGINGKVWIKCGDGLKQAEVNQEVDRVSYVKDLKYTLAASKYIMGCQNIDLAQIDQVLKDSFKNI